MNNCKELGQFIPIHYHFNMLHDRMRMEYFENAINMVVQPNDVVLELGSGTGVLSYFASKKAKKVYSVEYNEELVDASRKILSHNNCLNVEVIHADAFEYVPPERVQVVICEMLHVGLLREKQLEVIKAFKENYKKKFGESLPMFIPATSISAVQLIQYDFDFYGFFAPIVLFQNPYALEEKTVQLSFPSPYHDVTYDTDYSLDIEWAGQLEAITEGKFNALRFITKNLLSISLEGYIDWHNQYMVVPVNELHVKRGDSISIEFGYNAGASLTELKPSISVLELV